MPWVLTWAARSFVGFCVCLGMSGPACPGQEAAGESKPAAGSARQEDVAARRLAKFKKSADSYRISLESVPPRPLMLKAEPVLRWTNPLRKTSDGAAFLWASEGRPIVVACFYQYGPADGGQEHEFQSLATTGLTAARNGRDVWFPRAPGITPVPMPGAPAPAATPADRLRQMRALAREFSTFLDLASPTELRLLPKPIYRHEARQADPADGALFVFVQATDPEVLLLIDVRYRDGAPAWHYALARMSRVNLRAEHKGQVVWRVERENDETNPRKPYITLHDVRIDGGRLNP
jgi:hypothetical protein